MVLRASPLEIDAVYGLGPMDDGKYKVTLARETTELETKAPKEYPLWIALDIMDPQNLGAILRTCYFFGIDGVVITSRGRQHHDINFSAPLSSVVSKASSGALEVMNLYTTPNLASFLKVTIYLSLGIIYEWLACLWH